MLGHMQQVGHPWVQMKKHPTWLLGHFFPGALQLLKHNDNKEDSEANQ